MRSLLVGLVLMSIGLGMLLTTVLDSWLRGSSYLWGLLLALLLLFAIVAAGITVVTRIR